MLQDFMRLSSECSLHECCSNGNRYLFSKDDAAHLCLIEHETTAKMRSKFIFALSFCLPFALPVIGGDFGLIANMGAELRCTCSRGQNNAGLWKRTANYRELSAHYAFQISLILYTSIMRIISM